MEVVTAEADPWNASLSPEKRAAIRDLHKLRPAWNLIAFVFVAIWAAAAWAMTAYPIWAVRLPGYLVIGMVVHAMAILMHEGIHGSLFRNKLLDRGLGFFFGAPALFSCTAYRVTHMVHHRFNRGPKDPDELTNLSHNRKVLTFAFYAWGAVGLIVYLFHIPVTALIRGTGKQRTAVVIEYALLAALYVGVILGALHYDVFDVVLHCWILPLFVAAVFGNVRGWAEHMMTRPGHPLTQSRTVTSNVFVSLFMCNLNYHLEHHLYPAMPWYQLPKLHRLLQEDYRKAGSIVYRSYARFVWDAVRIGPHGVAAQPLVSSPSH